MSGLFRTVVPRNFPVKLGDMTFYAHGWKLSCIRQYAEQGGVYGSNFVTNTSVRARRLTLKGRFFYLEQPAEVVLALDDAIRTRTLFSFVLREMQFTGASLAEYTSSEEAAEGVLPCELTLIVPGELGAAAAETEGSA